jgi:hypothetical protein
MNKNTETKTPPSAYVQRKVWEENAQQREVQRQRDTQSILESRKKPKKRYKNAGEEALKEDIINLRNGFRGTSEHLFLTMVPEPRKDLPNIFSSKNSDFYPELMRLACPDLDPNEFAKPRIIALLTLRLIYCRTKEGIEMIRLLRKYNRFRPKSLVRINYFYRFFNDKGIEIIKKHMEEVVSVARNCKDFEEFKIAVAEQIGISVGITSKLDFEIQRFNKG